MFPNDLIAQLDKDQDSLKPAEKAVARVVLAEPEFALKSSNTEIARKAGVSEPTVTRFCRSLGCSGVRDFKIQLAASMARGTPYIHRTVNKEDGVLEIGHKTLESAEEALTNTRLQLNPETLENAIEALAKAKRIHFFGIGCGSGIVIQDAQWRFSRLGMEAHACSDGHLQQISALTATPHTVIVAVSHTGRTREILDSAALARSKGARVIAITSPKSPLANLCDIPLLFDIKEDTDIYIPSASRMAHLAVLDILSIGVFRKRGKEALTNLRRVKEHLAAQRVGDDYQPKTG